MRAACVICGDLFVSSEDISATPCGHTFHSVCVIQWIERSKSCPQCRHKATQKNLLKLFFDTGGVEAADVDPDSLQQQIDNQKFQVRLKELEITKLKETSSTLTTQNKCLREEYKTVESQVRTKTTTILALKTQLQFMDHVTKEAQKTKDETKTLREELKLLQSVDMVVSGRSEDVEDMLNSYNSNHDGTRALATFCSILKKELNKTIEDKRKLRDDAAVLKRKMKENRQSYDAMITKKRVLEQTNINLQDDVQSLERENSSLKKKVNALQEAISSPSGDIKNSALHRLIAESPAPDRLKRPHSIQAEESPVVTPEVVRKMARSEVVAPSSEKDLLCIDLSSPPSGSQEQKVNRQPLSDTINVGTPTTGQHHNIFSKERPQTTKGSSSITSLSGDKVGYDGLGGHHKVDIFPKPNSFIKKRKGIRVTTKNGASSRVQSSTIKNFFQNTFED